MSPSASRVPPDQSGMVRPAATIARSGSRSRSGRVTWVSRVPSVKTSTGSPVAHHACARRTRASAYELIDPDTSTRRTTRRGRLPRRRHATSPGSPIRRSIARRVRRASTSPRRDVVWRCARRRGALGLRAANRRASSSRSRRDRVETSRWRSTSVAEARACTASSSRASPAPASPSSRLAWVIVGSEVVGFVPARAPPNHSVNTLSWRSRSAGEEHRVARPAR